MRPPLPPLPLHPVLGQGVAPATGEILGLLGWIIALAVVAVVVAFGLRLWLRDTGEPADPGAGTGFTLADLRALRDAGDLTEDEYAAARDKLIGNTRAAAEAEPEPAQARPAPEPDGGIVWDDDPEPDPKEPDPT